MSRILRIFYIFIMAAFLWSVPVYATPVSKSKAGVTKTKKNSTAAKGKNAAAKSKGNAKKSAGAKKRTTSDKRKGGKRETSADVKRQHDAARREIKLTEEQIRKNDAAVKRNLDMLGKLQGDIDVSKQKVAQAGAKVNALKGKISTLQGRVSEDERQLQRLRAEYLKAVKAMRTKRKEKSMLAFIFSSKNFNEAVRRIRYLKQFVTWRDNQTKEITGRVAKLKRETQELARTKSQHDAQLALEVKARNQLQGDYARQDAVVSELKKNGQALHAHLAKKQAEANALNGRIASLIAEETRRAEAERATREREERLAQQRAEAEQRERERKAEAARIAAEQAAERERQAEQKRQAELVAQAEREAREQEEAARKADATRKAEAKRKAEEAKRRAEEAKKRAEAAKRKAEAERRAAEQRAEAERAAEAKRLAEAKERKEKQAKEKQASSQTDREVSYAEARRRRPKAAGSKATGSKAAGSGSSANVPKPVKSEAAQSGGRSFESMRGSLPRPVGGSFRVTSRFGRQSLPNMPTVSYDNPGIDAEVAAGASACAVFDGKVSGVYMVPGYSTVVIVNHGTYYTVYGHLAAAGVKPGDKVRQGQSLGRVAADEDNPSIGSIHFEVWRNRDKQDPLKWIR